MPSLIIQKETKDKFSEETNEIVREAIKELIQWRQQSSQCNTLII